ncbi:MAG: HAMP domain-containing histidine kinase [Gammaproteobacteria bacterium]|nr:HAMP domain-containing histidine kinase [Gammaproteobacteria bacterium]
MVTHALIRPAHGEATAGAGAPAEFLPTRQLPTQRDLARQVDELRAQLRQSRDSRQQELAAKERAAARLRQLLQALPGGVVVLDGDGRVEQFNPVAADLLESLVLGASWAQVVRHNLAPRWDDGHDVTLRNGRRVNISTQAPAHEPGQIVLLTDVTETRRLQEGLHLYKRLSANTEVAAALAHQLRTPLAAALLDAAQLARDSNERTSAGATRVRDALRRLERLIEDVLLFARGGELGALPTTSAALLQALRAAVVEMRLPAGFAVIIAPVSPDAAAALLINQDAILSGMLNLVHNAAQASAGAGTLHIACHREGAMLCFAFADDGPGIASDAAERIFEPFVTLRAGGTGMGLPVARSVARAHGGELDLARSASGGALFELRLPVFAGDPSLHPIGVVA